jgi:hypothetical protein
MKIETAWVAPPKSIRGLDHLGTQAPCILIYGQLLPGITNVTYRARYYSFYPWLIWSYDQRFAKSDSARFIELFRRADCLFTLISERHARFTGGDNEQHGAAMVGRDQLVSALDRLEAGEPLQLSRYTAQDSPRCYFQNPMGGLGQYYAGTLSYLNLMDTSAKPWIMYTKEHGAPLAKKVDVSVPGDRFWSVIESDDVTIDDLNALSEFCACRLSANAEECKTLIDIYFDTYRIYGEEGSERRRSLALIQQLVHSLPEGYDLSEALFRACSYSGTLPNADPWIVPETLHSTLAHWAIYIRNDLLSVAFQSVFALSLGELQPQALTNWRKFHSIELFATSFSATPEVATVLNKFQATSFGELLKSMSRETPSLEAWGAEGHEIQIAKKLLEGLNRGESAVALVDCVLRLLVILVMRDDPSQSPYGNLAMSPDALSDYPINLASFRQRVSRWYNMPVPEMFADLVTWCLNTHMRVALRKLRQTGRSSFHLRPSEYGLEVVGVEIPLPTHTTPRFWRAVQILRDIGALTRDLSTQNRQTRLTEIGEKLMEAACA